jgi:hypothetical protein
MMGQHMGMQNMPCMMYMQNMDKNMTAMQNMITLMGKQIAGMEKMMTLMVKHMGIKDITTIQGRPVSVHQAAGGGW